jgi:hypothetical protein
MCQIIHDKRFLPLLQLGCARLPHKKPELRSETKPSLSLQ